MKILQKIKVLRRQEMRPLLKPAVLALVLGAAYGLGKCSGENNGERRLAEKDRQFAAKEQAYLRKIDDLSIKANPFRFYEIDGLGSIGCGKSAPKRLYVWIRFWKEKGLN